MSTFHRRSRRIALCGILAALALLFLSAGSILPAATFCCPILAMLCLLPVVEEYGPGTALLLYAAVTLLALLLVADKEAALLFTFLGWYPALRPGLECRIPGKLAQLLVKLALFAAAVGILYAAIIPLLGMHELAAEYAAAGQVMTIVMILMGGVIWLLFDRILARFTVLYRKKWRKILFPH